MFKKNIKFKNFNIKKKSIIVKKELSSLLHKSSSGKSKKILQK